MEHGTNIIYFHYVPNGNDSSHGILLTKENQLLFTGVFFFVLEYPRAKFYYIAGHNKT